MAIGTDLRRPLEDAGLVTGFTRNGLVRSGQWEAGTIVVELAAGLILGRSHSQPGGEERRQQGHNQPQPNPGQVPVSTQFGPNISRIRLVQPGPDTR